MANQKRTVSKKSSRSHKSVAAGASRGKSARAVLKGPRRAKKSLTASARSGAKSAGGKKSGSILKRVSSMIGS